ncbi:PAS domain S-box protein [Limnospira fusiformis KN01]|nr:PAS domain S-box protein [Limnospira fusiformis KN01]
MDALEAAVRKTEAIVETATDAILTFTVSSLVVLTANPSAEAIFGYGKEQLIGMEIRKLVRADDNSYNWDSLLIEKWLKSPCQSAIGWRADGSQFPV